MPRIKKIYLLSRCAIRRNGHLFLILTAALILRLYHLAQQSVWFDEWLFCVALPSTHITTFFRNLWLYVPEMAITPVYLSLAYAVSHIAGAEVLALRMLSLLPGMISIILIYVLGRRLGKARSGLVAAWCLALSPQHIWHNQEIRPYSLLFMFCLIALLGLVHWQDSGRRRWFWVNFFANSLLIFTHLLGVLFLLPQGFYLLQRGKFKTFIKWSGSHLTIVTLLFCVILIKPHLSEGYQPQPELSFALRLIRDFPPLLLQSLSADVLRWHTGLWPAFESGTHAIESPYLSTLLFMRPAFDGALTLLIVGCIALFFLGDSQQWIRTQACLIFCRHKPGAGNLPEWALLVTLMLVPSTLLAMLTLIFCTNFLDYGHDIYATIGVYSVMGIMLSRLPGRFFRIAVAALILLYGYQCLLFLPGSTRTEWRLGAAYVQDNASSEDLILDYWWYGAISRREPYFSDTHLPFRRVNTPAAICDEAAHHLGNAIESKVDSNAEASVWLLVETRPWGEWFPKKEFVPFFQQGLHSRGLTCTVQEFPGGYTMTVVRIQRLPGVQPRPSKTLSPELWTCDYDQLLTDLGLQEISEARKTDMLYTLEDTIGLWPGISAMGRLAYPLDLIQTGDLDLAEAMAKYIVLENPSFGLGYFALGLVWAARGEDQRALAAFSSASAHHLGLEYFFGDYFSALCRDKDLGAASASLTNVQELVIPVFHETAAYILHQRQEKQKDKAFRNKAKLEAALSPTDRHFPEVRNRLENQACIPENGSVISSIWDESLFPEAPPKWIDKLFEKQETISVLAGWFPFHKQVASLFLDIPLYLTGNVEAAVAGYSELIRKFPFEKKFYDHYDLLLLRLNNSFRYVQSWLDCAQYNPEIALFVSNKLSETGVQWYNSGNIGAAIQAYNAAYTLTPQNRGYVLRLAQLYDFCSDTPAALHWYGAALEEKADFAEVIDRAELLLSRKNISIDALAFWKAILERHPKNWRVEIQYGKALEAAKDYETAAEFYHAMGQHHPGQLDTEIARSRCLYLAGKLDEARQVLLNVAGVDADMKALVAYEFIDLGQAYTHVQEYTKAVACYEAAITLQEHKALALFGLSETYMAMGNGDQALETLRQAVALAPGNPWYLRVLAQKEESLGNITAALSDYEKALRIEPNDESIALHLDTLLKKYRTPAERIVFWEALAAEYPDSDTLRLFQDKAIKASPATSSP